MSLCGSQCSHTRCAWLQGKIAMTSLENVTSHSATPERMSLCVAYIMALFRAEPKVIMYPRRIIAPDLACYRLYAPGKLRVIGLRSSPQYTRLPSLHRWVSISSIAQIWESRIGIRLLRGVGDPAFPSEHPTYLTTHMCTHITQHMMQSVRYLLKVR